VVRGGGVVGGGIVGEDDEEEGGGPPYFPGLLDAIVSSSAGGGVVTAHSDSGVVISQAKASELKLKDGDLVAVIGKRRRASYARVDVAPRRGGGMARGVAKIGRNLASNLRVRDDERLRIVTLDGLPVDVEGGEGGDGNGSYGLGPRPTNAASSVTFHPLRDSSSYDADEMSDEMLADRFVRPYLEGGEEVDGVALLRQGHVLSIADEGGVVMEFTVGHVDVDGKDDDDNEKDGAEGGGKRNDDGVEAVMDRA
jgi:hypothetical protein